MEACPGFSQARVNFHQNPGRGTAGRADPTWPNKAGYSIPCAVMLDSGAGGGAAGAHSRLGSSRCRSCPGERLSGWCGFCRVFSLSVSLLFLFPLFAVLLNCPYLDPPVSSCFFPFSSAPRWGEGRPRGTFVADRNQTRTKLLCQYKTQTSNVQFNFRSGVTKRIKDWILLDKVSINLALTQIHMPSSVLIH